MMTNTNLDLLKRIARGIARQFGEHCEVVVHSLENSEHTIVAIENPQVTHRELGDGPSRVVLEALSANPSTLHDRLSYLTKTRDGRILKSSTIYVRDEHGSIDAILSINYDITSLMVLENAVKPLISVPQSETEPPRIANNVTELLDDLIEQSVALTGKPVALMTKEDKSRAIRFLSKSGAFLITKSSDKISKYFGISKYTLYNYIDSGAE